MRDAFHLAGLALAVGIAIFISRGQDDSRRSPEASEVAAGEGTETEGRTIVSDLLGSAHDFSHGEPHPRDMCLPCHAPHLPGTDARPAKGRAPTSQPMRSYTNAGVALNGASLLCVGCHDGVVATDVFTNSHSTRLASQLGASQVGYGGLVGHPVGVKYPLNDPKYQPIAVVTQNDVIRLPDGRIQCTSCHDPHNTGRHAGLLVKSNERSRLCLSCHKL